MWTPSTLAGEENLISNIKYKIIQINESNIVNDIAVS